MTLINYKHIPIKENDEPLILLSEKEIILSPEYFKSGVSDTEEMYLRKGVIEKLREVSKQITPYKLKLWDGFRLLKVQGKLYENISAEIRKAHPEMTEDEVFENSGKYITPIKDLDQIPPHLTGGSIDLTLVDSDGKEVDMGTCFDHFGEESCSSFSGLTEEVSKNRDILRNAMISQGFRPDCAEWWHYDYGNQLWAVYYGEEFAIYGEASFLQKT